MTRDQDEYRSARDRAKEETSGFSRPNYKIPEGMKLFKLVSGIMSIDIIPFRAGKGNPHWPEGKVAFDRVFYVHGNIGANRDAALCLRESCGRPCPICEAKASYRQNPNFDKEMDKALRPKKRQLFYVMDHAHRDFGVMLWDVSFHLFGKVLNDKLQLLPEGHPHELFYHPTRGVSLRLMVKEKSMGADSKPFCEVTSIEFADRTQQYPKDIVDQYPSIDELITPPTYDALRSKFYMEDPVESEEESQEVPTPPPAPKAKPAWPIPVKDEAPPPPKPKPKPAPPVDEDEAPPPPKPKPKPAPPVDEDDTPPPKLKTVDEADGTSNGIREGMMVFHNEHGRCEVVRISGDGTSLRLQNSEGGVFIGIAPEDCTILKPKPKPAPPVDEDEAPPPPKPKPKPKPAPPVDEDEAPPPPKPKPKPVDDGWDDDLPPPPKKKPKPPVDDE